MFSRFVRRLAPLAAVGALAAASPAAADANLGLQVLREYNLVVLGDLKSSSDVEGRTFVGGSVSGGSANFYTRGGSAPASTSGVPGLTVVGSVSGGWKNLNNGSGANIGGSASQMNLNGGGQKVVVGGSASQINGSSGGSITVGGAGAQINGNGSVVKTNQSLPGFTSGLQVTATDYAMGVKDLSAYLAGLTATDTVSFPLSNRIKFEPKSTGSLAVFNLASTDVFKSVGEIEFLTGGFDTIIVNVGGSAAKLGKNFVGSTSGLGQHVIWNFYEATSLDFASNSFYGSVLAPYADTKINNFIQGSTVVGSLNQNGAVRLDGFAGQMQVFQSAVPEPATWAMMIVGFGLAGAAIRRRNRQALAA